jgi:dTDP-glucose pyrophosphorylase
VIIKNGKIIEIIEKTIKTKNSLRLAGIYFFKNWEEYLKNSKKTLYNQLPINGRYFVSQVYNEYLKDKKKITLSHVKKHITFGLIAYIDEYNFWYKYFYKNIKNKLTQNFDFLNLIPSAGEGSRFIENNKDNFKPLVNVGAKLMISKALESLPKSKNNAVIIREDHNRNYDFKKIIK